MNKSLNQIMLVAFSICFLSLVGLERSEAQVADLAFTIDIKPGSDPNSVNTKRCNDGVIPVALMGSESNCNEGREATGCDIQACEDAVCAEDPFCCNVSWDDICVEEAALYCGPVDVDATAVDITTLGFGPSAASPAHDLTDQPVYQEHLQDVNSDSLTDLVSHYRCAETGIGPGDTEACLSGLTLGDLAFDSNCLSPNGTPGCDDATCEAIVGAEDPFCVDTAWDSRCAEEAAFLCNPQVAFESCDEIKTVGGNPN